MTRKMPEIIEVNSQQLEELLERVTSNTLREEDTELIGHVFNSYMHLFEIVGDKNTTIARLRKLFFGSSSEKTEKITGEQQDPDSSLAPDGDNAASEPTPSELKTDEATGKTLPPGHGRPHVTRLRQPEMLESGCHRFGAAFRHGILRSPVPVLSASVCPTERTWRIAVSCIGVITQEGWQHGIGD